MPPLLCPSPVIMDQSFPRDEQQLRIVAAALGELQACIQKDRVHLILTDTLRDLVEAFDWNPPRPYELLTEIHHLLSNLFLQPHRSLVRLDLSGVNEYRPHPVPIGAEQSGLVVFWSEEMGKLLTIHNSCCDARTFFIGIACELAFAGFESNTYDNPENYAVFPLVGPADVDLLADAYEWDVPTDIRQKSVCFRDAKRNCSAIGAIAVERPAGDSHYKVRFNGARPWTLDPNVDPIPDRFLRELESITGYSLEAIKTALLSGQKPKAILRLSKVLC